MKKNKLIYGLIAILISTLMLGCLTPDTTPPDLDGERSFEFTPQEKPIGAGNFEAQDAGGSFIEIDTTANSMTLEKVNATLGYFENVEAEGDVNASGRVCDETVCLDNVDTDTQLSQEQVEDYAGGMWTGNTETGITITYEDGDGTIDAVVDFSSVDDCSEINNCVPDAYDSLSDLQGAVSNDFHNLGGSDANTEYTAGGTLLDLTSTTFSLLEGTLTDGKFCKFVSGTGLVCNYDASTYTASGTLLSLDGTEFSLNEGTLTDTKYCTYEAGTGIVCNSDAGTYTAGTALTLAGTEFSVTADAIGDTQLAYNTGQHLTTTSDVQHADFKFEDQLIATGGFYAYISSTNAGADYDQNGRTYHRFANRCDDPDDCYNEIRAFTSDGTYWAMSYYNQTETNGNANELSISTSSDAVGGTINLIPANARIELKGDTSPFELRHEGDGGSEDLNISSTGKIYIKSDDEELFMEGDRLNLYSTATSQPLAIWMPAIGVTRQYMSIGYDTGADQRSIRIYADEAMDGTSTNSFGEIRVADEMTNAEGFYLGANRGALTLYSYGDQFYFDSYPDADVTLTMRPNRFDAVETVDLTTEADGDFLIEPSHGNIYLDPAGGNVSIDGDLTLYDIYSLDNLFFLNIPFSSGGTGNTADYYVRLQNETGDTLTYYRYYYDRSTNTSVIRWTANDKNGDVFTTLTRDSRAGYPSGYSMGLTTFGFGSKDWSLYPLLTDASGDLGNSAYEWGEVWAVDQSINHDSLWMQNKDEGVLYHVGIDADSNFYVEEVKYSDLQEAGLYGDVEVKIPIEINETEPTTSTTLKNEIPSTTIADTTTSSTISSSTADYNVYYVKSNEGDKTESPTMAYKTETVKAIKGSLEDVRKYMRENPNKVTKKLDTKELKDDVEKNKNKVKVLEAQVQMIAEAQGIQLVEPTPYEDEARGAIGGIFGTLAVLGIRGVARKRKAGGG